MARAFLRLQNCIRANLTTPCGLRAYGIDEDIKNLSGRDYDTLKCACLIDSNCLSVYCESMY